MPSAAPAPPPIGSEAARAVALPRDPGRATEVLYRRHGRTVFRFAFHLLGRREDAEDATQATFLAVHHALTAGTAVLDPGAWVVAIARNECMGRLRRASRTPFQDAVAGDAERVAEGGVESAAELRDELRIARRTLKLMPEAQREAFLLREWLGLGTAEVALALGILPAEVELLTGRARRSLVVAVGGLEPAIGCAATCRALEAGMLDRAAKVHLLRCPVCRGVRRALRPRRVAGAPGAAVARRLAGVLPGFGAGGGAIAALAAKTTAAPMLAKAAALVAAGLLAGGAVESAVQRSHPSHQRSAERLVPRGGAATRQIPVTVGTSHAAFTALTTTGPAHHARASAVTLVAHSLASPASRGGGATGASGKHEGRRGSAGDRASSRSGGTQSGGHDGGGDHTRASGDDQGTGSGRSASSGRDGSSGQGGKASGTTAGSDTGTSDRRGGDDAEGASGSGDATATGADGGGHGAANGPSDSGGGDAVGTGTQSDGGGDSSSSGPGSSGEGSPAVAGVDDSDPANASTAPDPAIAATTPG
jgi:RNA polymerase sigma factor (sigma-70 family)